MSLMRYTRRDWVVFCILVLSVFALGFASLTSGLPKWGDDHSAYIAEGISIADGTFEEQTLKNATLHPTPVPDETGEDGLVYAWGFPLMLSAVYRAVGFDRIHYSSIIFYKLPSLISFALLAGVLYLFYRRRFPAGISAFLALVFCASGDFLDALNIIYSDLPFLLFSMLTLLTVEVYLTHFSEKGWNILYALVFGATMWFTHEIRLNGLTVCLVALLAHVLCLAGGRVKVRRADLLLHLLPYAVFVLLTWVSETIWLKPATSNLSDVSEGSLLNILYNLAFYFGKIYLYLDGFVGKNVYVAGLALGIACGIGLCRDGIVRNTHLSVLLIGTLIVDILLPYRQGLRYVYNVLPILLMYCAYGVQAVWMKLDAGADKGSTGRARRVIALCLAVAVGGTAFFRIVRKDIDNISAWGQTEASDVYSEDAVATYRYIQEQTEADSVIAFAKPRSLYLNTGRMSFFTGRNGNELNAADYYLHYKGEMNSQADPVTEDDWKDFDLMYENDGFALYRIHP